MGGSRRLAQHLGCLLGCLVGLFAIVAEAKPSADRAAIEAQNKANELNAAGNAALVAKKPGAAYLAFAAAYRTLPSADGLYYLGLVALAEGNRVGAEDLLRRYLSDPTLAATPEATARQTEAQKLIQEAQGQTPADSAEVSVINDRTAFVFVDDRLVGQVPLSQPLLVPIGSHKITVEQGTQRFETELPVQPGRAIEMRVNRATGAIIVSLPPALLLLSSYTAVPPEAQGRLELSIGQAVRRERLAPLRKESLLLRFPPLAKCLKKTACQAELATRAEAEYALLVKIEGAPPPQPPRYKLAFEVLNAKVGDVAASAEVDCKGCSVEQAAARTEELIEQVLGRGTGRATGTVELVTTPPGAEVYLDERKLGDTPYTHALFAGSYTLSVRKPGFLTQDTAVTIEAEQTASQRLKLEPDPALANQNITTVPPLEPLVPRQPRPIWRMVVGAGLVATGAVLIGFGGRALGVNNSCIDEPMPPKMQCDARFDTLGVGGALAATGAVLSVAGLTLIVVPGGRPSRRP